MQSFHIIAQPEWEIEFLFHLHVYKQMLFCSITREIYQRWSSIYEDNPNSVLDPFMKEEHVVHLKKCFWNGVGNLHENNQRPAGIIAQTANSRQGLRKKDKKEPKQA